MSPAFRGHELTIPRAPTPSTTGLLHIFCRFRPADGHVLVSIPAGTTNPPEGLESFGWAVSSSRLRASIRCQSAETLGISSLGPHMTFTGATPAFSLCFTGVRTNKKSPVICWREGVSLSFTDIAAGKYPAILARGGLPALHRPGRGDNLVTGVPAIHAMSPGCCMTWRFVYLVEPLGD